MAEKPETPYRLSDLVAHYETGTKERIRREAAVSKTDKQRAARPKVKTATLTIRVSPANKKGLAALAEHLGLSQSDLLMQLAGERARACGIDWKDEGKTRLAVPTSAIPRIQVGIT